MKNNPLSIRNSSVELLKIVGIVLIIINHTVQTLHSSFDALSFNDYVLDFSIATTNIQYLLLAILRHSGAMGNTIFFVCSAWYLIDDNKTNFRKTMSMIIDVWVISIIICFLTTTIGGIKLDWKIMMHQFLPNLYANNWYITCYILFYLFHSHLNTIINSLNQRRHFRLALVMAIMYIACNFIQNGLLFGSPLMLWMTIYFCIAYTKKYMISTADNISLNIWLAIIAFIGNIVIILLTNFLGLRVNFLSDKLLYWNNNCNPFMILTSVALLNVARNKPFKNRKINYISRLSLLIYVIHENIILREYYRPMMWQYVYQTYGYAHVVLWVFTLSAIILIFGLISSIFYHHTIQKFSNWISNKIYNFIKKVWLSIEDALAME